MPHETKVNVKSLPEITQVSKGDYLIIETDDSGTKIIDFENFVIDETHTTFEPLLSGLQVDMVSLSAATLYSNAESVIAHGAKGDGVTDDTAAIKAAIAAGAHIVFPYGTYLVSETLVFSNGSYPKSQATSTGGRADPVYL